MRPPEELTGRLERLIGSRPERWRYREGGFSIAGRWSVDVADGRTVFCKLATSDDIARRLRDEHRNMSAIAADFRCDVLAWEDGDRPLLVLEDLLVAGGRCVLRAARMPKGPDPADELRGIGFRPDGICEATHPQTGEVRRTAYVISPVG